MRAALVAVAACLAAGLIVMGVLTHSTLTRQDRQISHADRQVSQLQGKITTMQASVNGSHRDLITCGDLEHLQISGIDSAGNEVTVGYDDGGGQNAVTLPAHCINQ